MQDKNTLKI